MEEKPRILVVDDNYHMRQKIMAILEEENYEFAEAEDENKATAIWKITK